MRVVEKPSGYFYMRETGPYSTQEAAEKAAKAHEETMRKNNEDYNFSFQQGVAFANTKPTQVDIDQFIDNCAKAMQNPATFFKAKGHSDGVKGYKAPSIILE
jgi:hypothetical protein